MIPIEKIKDIVNKHTVLEKELSSGNIDPKSFAQKSKELLKRNKQNLDDRPSAGGCTTG